MQTPNEEPQDEPLEKEDSVEEEKEEYAPDLDDLEFPGEDAEEGEM